MLEPKPKDPDGGDGAKPEDKPMDKPDGGKPDEKPDWTEKK